MGRDEKAKVWIAVYDVSGRRVAELLQGTLEAGWREVSWTGLDSKGRHVAAGVYFVRVESGAQSGVTRLTRLW